MCAASAQIHTYETYHFGYFFGVREALLDHEVQGRAQATLARGVVVLLTGGGDEALHSLAQHGDGGRGTHVRVHQRIHGFAESAAYGHRRCTHTHTYIHTHTYTHIHTHMNARTYNPQRCKDSLVRVCLRAQP